MKLILARHGNTFSPDMVPVFVGSGDDMPLVEEGYKQAERFSELMKVRQIKIDAIYNGPLQRTCKFAELVKKSLDLEIEPIVDERLNELDYGGWSGKTNDQIVAEYGARVFDGWNDQSIWPAGSGWGSTPEKLGSEVRSFVDDLLSKHPEDKTILVVTSNGRMRYFLKLIEGAFEQRQREKNLKVAPGNFCKLTFNSAGASLQSWNESPLKALQAL